MANSGAEPQVGIFWQFNRRLVIDSTPVSFAEPYGDCLTHPCGHLRFWTMLQQSGSVPSEVEYEEAPRGRVLFDKRRERYVLLADLCIRNNQRLVNRIMARLHLPPKQTDVDTDDHYRCSKCLARSQRRS